MLGFFDSAPKNIHYLQVFESTISIKKLQSRLMQVLHELNTKEFGFEEIDHPTVPEGKVIFEIGIASGPRFLFIDKAELKIAQKMVKKEEFEEIDLFCIIRYYKIREQKKTPLKFDYYLTRMLFAQQNMEFQISHEKGPRYISPEELTSLFVRRLNELSTKKTLRPFKSRQRLANPKPPNSSIPRET
jgi:hypothetical protein